MCIRDRYYGYEAQSNQLVEECAELIQAVNKYRRVETGLGQPVAEDVYKRQYIPCGGKRALQSILDAGGFCSFDGMEYVQELGA